MLVVGLGITCLGYMHVGNTRGSDVRLTVLAFYVCGGQVQ